MNRFYDNRRELILVILGCNIAYEQNLTVGEIGWQCGFQTTSFFIRKFKEYYFMTPAQYRLQANFENANPTE